MEKVYETPVKIDHHVVGIARMNDDGEIYISIKPSGTKQLLNELFKKGSFGALTLSTEYLSGQVIPPLMKEKNE